MGNRAVIQFGDGLGVYLHWNGGRCSVEAFLKAAKDLGIRSPVTDASYAAARFAQMVGNWFGGTTSVGVGKLDDLDTANGDNGTYVLGADWTIARRVNSCGDEDVDAGKSENIYKQVVAINKPIFNDRLGKDIEVKLIDREKLGVRS